MSAIAIIPARGGSRRVPRKNIRNFAGKPMVLYAIHAAQVSKVFDTIIVSTDDPLIAQYAIWEGCLIHRRKWDDGVRGTQDIAKDVLRDWCPGPEVDACVIYPCVPMLTAADLCFASTSFRVAKPEAPYVYIDGWFYYGLAESFGRVPLTEGLRIDGPSDRWIDIDTEDDWQRAERMYADLHKDK